MFSFDNRDLFMTLSVVELREFCRTFGIDIKNLRRKIEIVDTICRHIYIIEREKIEASKPKVERINPLKQREMRTLGYKSMIIRDFFRLSSGSSEQKTLSEIEGREDNTEKQKENNVGPIKIAKEAIMNFLFGDDEEPKDIIKNGDENMEVNKREYISSEEYSEEATNGTPTSSEILNGVAVTAENDTFYKGKTKTATKKKTQKDKKVEKESAPTSKVRAEKQNIQAKNEQENDKQRSENLKAKENTKASKKLPIDNSSEILELEQENMLVSIEQKEENREEISYEIKEGVLEIMQDGYGFLRAKNYESGEGDAYIASPKIKKSGLRKGDWVKAYVEKNNDGKPGKVINIISVNGVEPSNLFKRKNFDYLTPIYPDSRFRLEIDGAQNDFAIRSIDLVAPIGKGQRAMIVSPPKAGKTTLLKNVAKSISMNYPKACLIVLLIDERPEEVTDMQRSIRGEVVYSTFDETPEHHTKAAELVLERAKRLVELGEDVIILMDSLTRLARAYNLTISPTGRTLSGGIDPGALHSPKRFFGAARNIENGGSLTIIATALVDTGSRMDDVIYEEFKGTGNMEIHLDRRLTEKRIFPAIDLNRSGTRREELLLTQKELETVWNMRRMLNSGDGGDASEQMISELIKTKTNKEFMEQMDMKIKMMRQQGFWKN